jgi:hypothetical protein
VKQFETATERIKQMASGNEDVDAALVGKVRESIFSFVNAASAVPEEDRDAALIEACLTKVVQRVFAASCPNGEEMPDESLTKLGQVFEVVASTWDEWQTKTVWQLSESEIPESVKYVPLAPLSNAILKFGKGNSDISMQTAQFSVLCAKSLHGVVGAHNDISDSIMKGDDVELIQKARACLSAVMARLQCTLQNIAKHVDTSFDTESAQKITLAYGDMVACFSEDGVLNASSQVVQQVLDMDQVSGVLNDRRLARA